MEIWTDPVPFLITTKDKVSAINNGGSMKSNHKYEGSCHYLIRVYPTTDFEAEYMTNEPLYYALSLMTVFVFVSAILVLYDRVVEVRQRLVLKTAKAANDVVGLHYPKNIHKDLYNQTANTVNKNRNSNSASNNNTGLTTRIGRITDGTNHNDEKKHQISDSFESCTVMFADLTGFLEWSRGRDPVEIFLLLETIFECLDKLTKKHDVFKVETIGDTYLACTGMVSF